MTTQTTTSAPQPIRNPTLLAWQLTRGSLQTTGPMPVRLWSELVKAQKIGIADRSVQTMNDMTMNVANNKGRAGT
jgi:hypothetical protein